MGCYSLTKCLSVLFPVLPNFFHDALVFGIAAELVVVLVLLKPRIIVVTDLHCAAQPDQRLFLFSEQCVNASCPVCKVAVNDFRRTGA